MRCDEFQEKLLDSWADRNMPLPESLELHLKECGECSSFYMASQQLDSALVAHFAKAEVPDHLYRAVRRKALGRPGPSQIHGAAETLNWLGALALATVLAIYAGIDFGAPGAGRWVAVALLSLLAFYPGWLLWLSGEETPG